MKSKVETKVRKLATRVRAGALAGALRDIGGIVEGRNTIPVLDCVLFRAGDGRIELTATDLDLSGTRVLASDDRDGPASAEWLGSIAPFSTCIPAKPLREIVASFDKDAMVTIEQEDNRATISAGRARFRLASLPAGDFPMAPGATPEASFEMACSALADALAAVECAISTDETRYYLNGVFWHPVDLSFRMAATDGNRLARLVIDGPEGSASFPQVIVPRKAIAVLDQLLAGAAKADEAARVAIEACAGGTRLRFEMPAADAGEVILWSKAVDGIFPEYSRVIPTETPNVAAIGREALFEAVRRVAVLGTKDSNAIAAEWSAGEGQGGKLTLIVTNPDLGEAREELACSYAGADLRIGFNAKYWREVLSAIAADEVVMAMSDPGGPVRITGGDSSGAGGDEEPRLVQVLMPLRV